MCAVNRLRRLRKGKDGTPRRSASDGPPGQRVYAREGFTLIETVIALAVWLLLATGAGSVLVYASRASERLIVTQEIFENARASLDAITVNIQMANTVVLETDSDDVLKKLTLTERNPKGELEEYYFFFKRGAEPDEAKYHRLEFGENNEFASHIGLIKLKVVNDKRLEITVITDGILCPSVTISGAADIRYKDVSVKRL